MLTDLTGMRFTDLLVQGPKRNEHGKLLWECLCKCGKLKLILASRLHEGTAKSCGCRKAAGGWQKTNRLIHGRCYSAEYSVWRGMKRRCQNPDSQQYEIYGARGITVCEKWQEFEGFFEDMGERPSSTHTLERKDNSLGYTAENCRWATRKDQQNNRRCNYIVEAFGQVAPLADFFKTSKGKEYKNASYRIQAGWEPERAIIAAPWAGKQ